MDENENLEDLIGAPQEAAYRTIGALQVGNALPDLNAEIPLGTTHDGAPLQMLETRLAAVAQEVGGVQADPDGVPSQLGDIGTSNKVKLRRVSAKATGDVPSFTPTSVPDGRSQIMIDGELFADVPTSAVPWLKKILLAAVEGVGGPIIPESSKPAPAYAKPGPKGKAVRVVRVDYDCDQPHRVGDMFDNAAQASRSVGLTPNSLCIAMRGTEGMAKLRGVTFQYEDDYQQEINGEGRASD